MRSAVGLAREILYDVPVSNHGARVRMIIKAKQLQNLVEVRDPAVIGGSKSPEYLKLNPYGKVPLLVTDTNFAIPESDCIARYILRKYDSHGPSFIPKNILQESLSNQVSRFHDVYISPVVGSMYKPKGYIFSVHGLNRKAGLDELKKQLHVIEDTVKGFREQFPALSEGDYLCGPEISLADATLFPTMIFCDYMLPQYFGWQEESYKGPLLTKWMKFMHQKVLPAQEVGKEVRTALEGWTNAGRFGPIMEEMKTYS